MIEALDELFLTKNKINVSLLSCKMFGTIKRKIREKKENMTTIFFPVAHNKISLKKGFMTKAIFYGFNLGVVKQDPCTF